MERSGPLRSWAGARVAVLSPTPTWPQDFGNRKRVFRVCSRFAEEGARVTFLHYPAELEWRGQLPSHPQREMAAQWSQYFTIPATRTVHEDPRGSHHSIDEWWDRSIGDFLGWLFSVQSFEAFVVNYSWLSKALEFAPRTTFKILDTHDKFSGRREMLESLKLNPEFFYTTAAQEKIALDRADLVWAIKREEAAQLQEMTEVPVLALPHLDPLRVLPGVAPDAQGYLRVGVIGARNNVNRMNITEFVKVAEPIFRAAFAPVKIVIAGSVCDLLEFPPGPFVELRGKVDDVEDFYRSVDCVAVPMRTSTGLKIKTGEALSLGLPIVSLAHAFEGYEAQDRLHGLNDFADMARALVELSFAPREALRPLAKASLAAHEKTSAAIDEAFRQSDAMARASRRSIVIAVDSRAFVPASIFHRALKSMHDYLRGQAIVTMLVASGQASDLVANPGAVDRFRRVVVASDIAGAGDAGAALAALNVDVFDAGEFMRQARPTVLIADAAHPALASVPMPGTTAISRSEMIALASGDGRPTVLGRNYGRAFVMTPTLTREVAAAAAAEGAAHVAATLFWRSHEMKFRHAADMSGERRIALLGSPSTRQAAMAAGMAQAWGLKPDFVRGIGTATPSGFALPCFDAGAYAAEIVAGRRPLPHFAIDLSDGGAGLIMCRELLQRLHVPLIATSPIAAPRSLALPSPILRATTEAELWSALRCLTLGSSPVLAKELAASWRIIEGDGGWTWLWRTCKGLFGAKAAQTLVE